MANAGFNAECADTEALFVGNFSGFDYIVSPGGSCVHHVRDNFDAIEQTDAVKDGRGRSFQLVEYRHGILTVDAFPWDRFPHRVGLRSKCGTFRRFVIMMLLGRREDIITTGFTTVVVMVVAATSPVCVWRRPLLRLADTVVGIAIGVSFRWLVHFPPGEKQPR
jgi:hypothetical protein